MSGAVWAALSGTGFGLFQALNGRAVRDLESAYVSTFLQLLAATAILAAASLATEDLSAVADASAWGVIAFALAGLIHFFGGWTALNLSQARIGAARTSPLLAMTPLFGLAVAAIVASQLPAPAALGGIALSIAGAALVAGPAPGPGSRLAETRFGLATALAWATSPVLAVEGLETLHSPLLGVTIGMLAALGAYAALALASPTRLRLSRRARDALPLKLAAGIVVALATWGRWVALDGATVAVVLALNLISVPVVLVLAPVISGRAAEPVTIRVWVGAALVVLGSLSLILAH